MIAAVDDEDPKRVREVLAAFSGDPKLKTRIDVVSRLAQLCRIYKISADELLAKWEAHAMRIDAGAAPQSVDELEPINDALKKALAKTATAGGGRSQRYDAKGLNSLLSQRSTSPTRARTPKTPKTQLVRSDGYDSSMASSPLVYRGGLGELGSGTPQKYLERNNRGKKEEVFNDSVPYTSGNDYSETALSQRKAQTLPHVECSVTLLPDQQIKPFRYMYERLRDIGDALNDRIEKFYDVMKDVVLEERRRKDADAMEVDREQNETKDSDENDFQFVAPSSAYHSTSIVTLGRVACDALENAKLNDGSVVLEPSREIGAGKRVALNLADVQARDGFAVFPGQIIAVEGLSPNGTVLHASRVWHPPIPPKATTSMNELLRYYPVDEETSKNPLLIMCASGPFTLEDTLTFEPLEDFVSVVEKEQPDVVILLGPFVDSDHPMILNGNIPNELLDEMEALSCNEGSFTDNLFRYAVLPRIQRIRACRNGTTRCILVPSTRDGITQYFVFPQPPVGASPDETTMTEHLTALGLLNLVRNDPHLYLCPNPVQFCINELVFAISTTDILFHLAGEEFARKPTQKTPSAAGHNDRVARLFRHVLEQSSFYPLFPPAKGSYLSLTHGKRENGVAEAIDLKAAPDVLILPSVLKYGVKEVDGVLCVNPGVTSLQRSAGTFARFVVHPLDVALLKKRHEHKGLSEEEWVAHNVSRRMRVEIERI
ncbi:DNA polymerase alpha/epsilon subunit B-domain-containing protein [Cladochytrium replicatum]|nr:DNA polymerase alpha/epsilon subunit B-domain-containing protein [Cladochytrium replicatum]